MSYYGGTITVKGRDLITSLIAGETIEFTRIVVGSGQVPEGVEPIDMEALVEPVAEATSTVPTVENSVLSMVVEYRNDLNGGLQTGFWLREFGIFAKTENSEEILLYYATLGDSPSRSMPTRTTASTFGATGDDCPGGRREHRGRLYSGLFYHGGRGTAAHPVYGERGHHHHCRGSWRRHH